MPATGWMRKWRARRDSATATSAAIIAAAQGDSLADLLHLCARALLKVSNADRAGLWLSSHRGGVPGTGSVVEAQPGPMPEEWKRLDISTPFLRAALESANPLRVDLAFEASMPRLGPLIGMRSALWIPLRSRARTVGLGMVSHARPPGRLDLEAIGQQADEIALAVQYFRNSRRGEFAAEDLRTHSRLARAILCGVSTCYLLRQIAQAARSQAHAEFIALGTGSAPPMGGEGWEGSAEWRAFLQRDELAQLWTSAWKDGRESEISEEGLARLAGFADERRQQALERIVAIPIEGRSGTRGVLMAGLSRADDAGEDYAKLESYALLAAGALDRDAAREQRASHNEALRSIVQGSDECLLVIDGRGRILETSRGASRELLSRSDHSQEERLEDLFSAGARDAVIEWRQRLRLFSPERPNREGSGPPAPALEAPLARRGVARLRLRSEVHVSTHEAQRWLIDVEDRSGQLPLHEMKDRMEAEMAGLVDSIESGVLLLDADGRIRLASARLGVIFGIESQRLIGFGAIHELIDGVAHQFLRPAETAARWHDRLRQSDEASWDELELVRPSRKIVERYARPLLKADGTRLGWLEVFRDITGQRLIHTKLLQTEKMAALGQLVSGIAHELNNPLTSIQGYAQLLLGRRSGAERASDALRISQEAERAGRIVKNLLLFSREAKAERRAVDMNDVIEQTLALRAYELKLQNIDVELSLDRGVPQTLADAAQMQQVVLNLLVNAEQAIVMARGEEPRSGRILISTERLPGDRLAMKVSDDGPGIPPEIASHIFDPFFTTKPPGVGTGLGLSIVYGIVQEHGGEVSVDSSSGGGATLTVELPALSVSGFEFPREEASTERHATPVVALPVLDWKASWRDVLIVEDEPTVAELIADVLTEEGYRVETLLDSRGALGRLEAKCYSLVICDLKMPYVDGQALYRALVRHENPMQHRLLFVTGDTMGPRTIEFLKTSALPFLAKPFLVEELKEAVRQALASVRAGEELDAGTERSRAAAKET